VVNRFVTNAARLENVQLEAPSELHSIQATELPEFVHRMEADGVNLLVYIDSKTKKDSVHDKIKELQDQCKNMRIQHVQYKSVYRGGGADNIRKAVAASLQKMGYKAASQN
jgi:DhnA family fructose-bisphosphate aldolase class Ia